VPARIVTAVALYGPKPRALAALLATVQAILVSKLGGSFRPYALGQIHSTVIRLDGARDPQTGLIVSQRQLQATGHRQAMDLPRALQLLAGHFTPPLGIRIGGWGAGTPPPFISRGQHPYQRMFSAQGGAFVLVGWPLLTLEGGAAAKPLDDLRREMASAHIGHFYHDSPADIDNDFHLVVGHYSGASPQRTTEAATAVRSHLEHHPVDVAVGPGQLAIIAADSPTLVPARFVGRLPLDPAVLAGLYR
jgi:hypothetical protein